MRQYLILLVTCISSTLLYAQKSTYAVEVAAFAQPVKSGHFKELKGIYETIDANYVYRYYLDAKDLADAQNKQKEVINAGFAHARVINFEELRAQCDVTCQYVAPKATGKEIIPFVPEKKTSVNITHLRCIFFDFDRSFLRSDAKEELDRLVLVMRQNPTFTVDISGHTDAKGSQEYNQRLAKRRTSETKAYLIKAGIAAHRMAEKTFGENDPIAINHFSDGEDATAGRQYNRRVAFTLRNAQGNVVGIVDKIRVPDTLQKG